MVFVPRSIPISLSLRRNRPVKLFQGRDGGEFRRLGHAFRLTRAGLSRQLRAQAGGEEIAR